MNGQKSVGITFGTLFAVSVIGMVVLHVAEPIVRDSRARNAVTSAEQKLGALHAEKTALEKSRDPALSQRLGEINTEIYQIELSLPALRKAAKIAGARQHRRAEERDRAVDKINPWGS